MTILLISYDKLILRALNYLCITEQHTAQYAESAEAAFSALAGNHFDVVIIGSDIAKNEQHEFANAAKRDRSTAVLLLYDREADGDSLADANVNVADGTEAIRAALRRLTA